MIVFTSCLFILLGTVLLAISVYRLIVYKECPHCYLYHRRSDFIGPVCCSCDVLLGRIVK